MITYCCTDKCDKRMSCKRYAVYASLSSTAKLQKSIIDLSRICPQNNYSLFISLPVKQKIKIYCIMGRSASGKTTISNELSKRTNIKTVKSYTTRPMRTGEIQKLLTISLFQKTISPNMKTIMLHTQKLMDINTLQLCLRLEKKKLGYM